MFNILIVEDNATDSQIMSFIVKRIKCNPIIAFESHQAIEIAQKYKIDLILLDWMLPNLNGLQLLKTFRSQDKLKSIPIILVSGKNEVSDVERAIKGGATDYVVKPIDPVILEGKISKHLRQDLDWKPIKILDPIYMEGKITNHVKVISISELGVEIETEINFPVGISFLLSSPLFEKIEISCPVVSIFDSIKVNELFRYKCSLVGMKEVDLQKIRLYLRLIQIDSTLKVV